jgi:hypothetical protein
MSISVSNQSLRIAKRNRSNFDVNSVISFRIELFRRLTALSTPYNTPNVVHVDFSVETIPANRKTQSFKFRRKLCHFAPDWDITAYNAISTPFDTPYVVHVDFSVETIPANRKTQSFKFRRKLCYFIPDWDITAFKRSFHSIRYAVCSACRFQCRNNPCKSQNAIFQISTKTLSLRSWLSYYGI